MAKSSASTQYNDMLGSASATWHASGTIQGVDEFASHYGVPETELMIGLKIDRGFGINRMGPEDDRETASLFISIYTVSKSKLDGVGLVEYLANASRTKAQITEYHGQLKSTDDLLDFFKRLEIILFTKSLQDLDFRKIPTIEKDLESNK